MIAHGNRSFALLDARNGEGAFVELAPQPSVQQIGQALVLGRGDPAAVW